MQNAGWHQVIQASADPHRARHYLELLREVAPGPLRTMSEETGRFLTSLFAGSQALSELLLAHTDWLASVLVREALEHPRQEQGLRREVEQWLRPLLQSGDHAAALSKLRQFKQREMLRIAVRDLARLATAPEITREISNVADLCLRTVLRVCLAQFHGRLGQPWHVGPDSRWSPTPFCVLGMGKLGGQELNYSSDVDVLFVYGDEGEVFREPPRRAELSGRGLSNHQFFKRVAEAFIEEVGKLTPDGMLFRIDLRLRPEGNAGPLVRSLGSYENYYAQYGQTWERMMLIKARCVAGDEGLAAEFLEMVQPFRYPRSLAERMLREVTEMKDRIEREVVRGGELDRNVKLGRGGIREIEFVVQTLQLLHAGRQPFLQGAQTLPLLQKLEQYRLLPPAQTEALTAAYVFLRDVEHRLQMENNLQTHTIPTERKARERLARLMGSDTLAAFEQRLQNHMRTVREIYDRLLKGEDTAPVERLPREIEAREVEWKQILGRHRFRDVNHCFRLVAEFLRGPGFVLVTHRTTDLALQLLPRFLALCPKVDEPLPVLGPDSKVLSDPDRVLARLDTFVGAYGSRATLFEMWASNPALFELLLLLFDRSEFLAESAIRTPDLVDELVLSGRLRRRKSAAETLAELRHGQADDDQRLWLRRYHQAEFMRIGLRDILRLADLDQNLEELSALADACLQYALEAVLRKHRLKTSPFAIIGLGKLGGQELNYGSDLDIVFVSETSVAALPKLQKIAAEVMEMLASQTELGVAFHTDARLRPDGEKGLLVNTLKAYEEYYRNRAQLWELQALTRARAVAGNPKTGEAFEKLAAVLTDFRQPSLPLIAYRDDWRREVARMRARIEKERTPAGKQTLAIKTGAGGLMDAEFLAQVFCLANGWREPNTLHALLRAREAAVLARADADLLIDNYRALRQVEGILRRWSFEGETTLPDDPAPFYRVSVRCGFQTPDAFAEAVANYRDAIRTVYSAVMATA